MFVIAVFASAAFSYELWRGGGGGGGGVVVAPSPVPTPTSTVTRGGLPVPTPTSTETVTVAAPAASNFIFIQTSEYSSNYGLGNIKANAAYQRGVYGQDVTVGVVDSGIRLSHADLSTNLVAGRRSDSGGNVHTDVNDADGHGTFVAGVIGGVRGNDRFHGVAPAVDIMPLQIGAKVTSQQFLRIPGYTTIYLGTGVSSNGDPLPLYHHAATAGVHILNNSYGYTYYMPATATVTIRGTINVVSVVLYLPYNEQINDELGDGVYWQNKFADIKTTIGPADMLMVWAAGNHGWHAGDGVSGSLQIRDINKFNEPVFLRLSDLITSGVDLNDPGGYALAPLYEPELTDRWLVVAAVDSLSVMAGFSNGCGNKSRYWCLAAPGVDISSAANTGNTDITVGDGTSFAAPHVAGALALIKSRLPSVPMRAARVVLLETATDLGATGVDPVYGHGHLNVEAAMTAAGIFTVYGYGNLASFSQSGVNLPSHYADFAARLADVSIAVRYLDKYHYDTRLGISFPCKRLPILIWETPPKGFGENLNRPLIGAVICSP